MRQYADSAAYAAYFPDATVPANVDTLLRGASRVVDRLLLGRVYDVDAAGMPTNADDLQALSDATCAIAGEADALGVYDAGNTQQWESVKIGTVQLQNLQGASTADSPVVLGLPVPASAIVALAGVGHMRVSAPGGGYTRPLDRVV